ncbi:MAG TPA: YggT family protein [Acidimicrobiales bacterium]|nr:YggT family protein [Acidimicrobiales bacterium]
MVIVCRLLDAYLILLFGRIILSWFPIDSGSVVASVFGFLYAVTEPVLGPIRRVIPPMGMGGMGFDFSPLIVILVVSLLRGVIC